MNLKKILLVPIGLALSTVGCASTYNMGATAFHYDLSYDLYMVKLNGEEIGLGGGGMATVPIKVGVQEMSWKDSRTGEVHRPKNQVVITKEQLKDKKYLAAHIYPEDKVEISTSIDWPRPTDEGRKILKNMRNKLESK